MGHPQGGRGSRIAMRHDLKQAYKFESKKVHSVFFLQLTNILQLQPVMHKMELHPPSSLGVTETFAKLVGDTVKTVTGRASVIVSKLWIK